MTSFLYRVSDEIVAKAEGISNSFFSRLKEKISATGTERVGDGEEHLHDVCATTSVSLILICCHTCNYLNIKQKTEYYPLFKTLQVGFAKPLQLSHGVFGIYQLLLTSQ